jgi:short-subunit dehydrogenase
MSSRSQAEERRAIITGASSGIGEAFARRLAADGFHLVLVARRQARLARLGDELRAAHGVEAEVLAADLSKPTDVDRVVSLIGDMPPLSLLVNNAGFGRPGRFHELDPASHTEMLQVHCSATVLLTRAALPGMVASRRGGVINVSSIAGLLGEVGGPMYSATKTFLVQFTRSLHSELRGTGVRVQALCPGLVRTEFHDQKGYHGVRDARYPRWFWMRPVDVVSESLAALDRGKVVLVPGLRYRLLLAMANNPIGRALADRYTDRPVQR